MTSSIRTISLLLLASTTGSIAVQALADNAPQMGATVGNVLIVKSFAAGHLGLKNSAAIKTVEALDLTVTGADPQFLVEGQVFCKSGARIVAVQAVAGMVVYNSGQVTITQSYAQSPKLVADAGKTSANVAIPLTLAVTRKAGDAAVDFSFNPGRRFEQKLATFVGGGGSAAEYLRQGESFAMTVPIHLIAWCKMSAQSNSSLAGKTYAGTVGRNATVHVLYKGDPAIVDGRGVRASAPGDVLAPAPPPTPKKAEIDRSKPKPERRDDF